VLKSTEPVLRDFTATWCAAVQSTVSDSDRCGAEELRRQGPRGQAGIDDAADREQSSAFAASDPDGLKERVSAPRSSSCLGRRKRRSSPSSRDERSSPRMPDGRQPVPETPGPFTVGTAGIR